jgi:hypothetical protein
VSELFIERTRTALGEMMGRRLDDVRLAVMMLDGLEIADRTQVVTLGITTEGIKIPLGLWQGSTENATLARTLLADLVDRGLDRQQAILFVIDGGKALRRAIKDVFGEQALVHRQHKECHEEGPSAGADLLRWSRSGRRPRWSSMSDSLGHVDARAGARRRPTARSSARTGCRPTGTDSRGWWRG